MWNASLASQLATFRLNLRDQTVQVQFLGDVNFLQIDLAVLVHHDQRADDLFVHHVRVRFALVGTLIQLLRQLLEEHRFDFVLAIVRGVGFDDLEFGRMFLNPSERIKKKHSGKHTFKTCAVVRQVLSSSNV